MENTGYIDEYLAIVFGTKDKAEIAERILGSPTLSGVRDAYNDYEKFCTVRTYKVVPAHTFMEYVCDEYHLSRKLEQYVTPKGTTAGKTVFCKEE